MGNFLFAMVIVTMTMHIPIEYFLAGSLHWVVASVAFAFFLMDANLADRRLSILLGYTFLVGLCMATSLLFVPPRSVFIGSLSYLLLPVIVTFGLLRQTEIRLRIAGTTAAWLGGLASAAAVYQYFYDPVFWGMYAGTSLENFSGWAVPRSPSFFQSPQVFAAFVTFSVILADLTRRTPKMRPTLLMTITMAGGALSGSAAMLVALVVYYGIKAIKRAPVLLITGALLASFGYLGLLFLRGVVAQSGSSSPLARMVAALGVGNLETGNHQRIGVWLEAIANSPILGNGIGSASTLVSGADRYNTESYWLALNYEGGIILVAAMLLVVLVVAKKAFSRGTIELKAAIVVFVMYAMVSHAFYASALPIVWVFLFGFAIKPSVRRRMNAASVSIVKTVPDAVPETGRTA